MNQSRTQIPDLPKWRWTDLNRRPSACKADALPTELHPLGLGSLRDRNRFDKASNANLSRLPKVGVPEFESGTSSLSATRSNQLSYTPLSDLSQLRHRRRSFDPWSREAAKCTETRLPVKGKKHHVTHRIDYFLDAVREFTVRFRLFDFADFYF